MLLIVAIGGVGVEYCRDRRNPPIGGDASDRALFEDQVFRVRRVIDGDTAVLSEGTTIRYIGIDAPEMVPVAQCGAVEATELNRELVEGKAVTIRLDPAETRDRFGRLLGYLDRDGEIINVALARAGRVCSFPFGGTQRFRDQIAAAESEARAADRGVWGVCSPVPRGCPR